jgi:DNA polymerase-3 subunit delta'
MNAAATLPGTEDQPRARVALAAELAGRPSHSFLFHGPAGVGKRVAARAFAAELLAAGADDPESVRRRVDHGAHPDFTWVRPTGAHVMRTEDVDEPVVAAAARTPFEASRRVFVLERVDTMNDEVANRLLKTLEEPPSFVHLILLTDALGQVLPTVVSRCQPIRFDALPAPQLAAALEREGIEHARASACARLAMGNGERARLLASEAGVQLRADVDRLLLVAVVPDSRAAAEPEPWRALLERAEAHREEAEASVETERERRLESEPRGRERSALERRFEEMAKRDGRRARTALLDLALGLVALGFRDLVCIAERAPEAALDADRPPELLEAAAERDPRRLRAAAERCEDARLSLELNVTEDLALEALGFRLAALAGPRAG